MKKFKKLLVMLLTLSVITASFAGMTMAAQKTGWQKNEYGYWTYVQKDGSLKTGWLKDKGKWYYLDEAGTMVYNTPYTINDKVYVFNKNGVMQSGGWTSLSYDDGYSAKEWFYVKDSGVALASTWKKFDGKWYYFNDYGYMAQGGTIKVKDKYYLFGNDGVWISTPGWNKLTRKIYGGSKRTFWYYLKNNGTGYVGWMKEGGKWYYLDGGYMANNGAYDINWENYEEGKEYTPKYYLFYKNGALVEEEGWLKTENTYGDTSYTSWFYAKSNGRPVTGWKKINGSWYFFNEETGRMYDNGAYLIGEKLYMFKANGKLETSTGWKKMTYTYADGEKATEWYYLKKGGVCQKGWKQISGKWYYFDPYTGYMYANGTYLINDKEYTFAKNGVWKK